jgi:RNA polymerase sigma factor (sigma-70 family)
MNDADTGSATTMATGQQAAVLEGVRRIFVGGTVAGLGSESLLHRFATRGDEAAFSAIVARHGPMVLGVCRRALRDPYDVEDAFQATFLVFVRKAGSIRDGDALGPWLHGVARRVAARARVLSIRRRDNERTGVDLDPAGPEPDAGRDEIRALVDEEIGRLPERYRGPIILCDLEGCTQPEAAGRLGWTEGSLRGRLARARELLRSRLVRRGLVAPAGAIVGLNVTDSAAAARMGESLARAAISAAAGKVEGVSTTAVALAKEVVEAMTRFKVLSVGLAAVVTGVSLTGAGAIVVRATKASSPQQGQDPTATRTAPNPADRPATRIVARQTQEGILLGLPPEDESDKPKPPPPKGRPPGIRDLTIPGSELKNPPPPEPADARRIAVGDTIIVEVLEALPGRSISGERPVRSDGTISLQWYGEVKVAGLTRREAKVKIIEHLRQWLNDESLGLIAWDVDENRNVWVHPARSDRVFVDDSPMFDNIPRPVRPSVSIKSSRSPEPPSVTPVVRGDDRIKVGDSLIVQVVETLPGRQMDAMPRRVRADGTISLQWYGDLKVAGLTRAEAKVKLIGHLQQWLSDKALGLVAEKDGRWNRVAPEQSANVVVDEVEFRANAAPASTAASNARIDALEKKLDRILEELQTLKKDQPR